MLMHSCYCILISVMGGFVQMLKDFKNLLKMSLKILFIKKKEISFHLLPFLTFGPLAPLYFFPRPSTSHSPARLPFSRSAQLRASSPTTPAQPCSPRWPSYARPSNCRRRAPSPRAQPLTPGPACRRCLHRAARQPPAPGAAATAATTRVVGASSPPLGLVKNAAEPPARPLLPPRSFLCVRQAPRKPQQPPQRAPGSAVCRPRRRLP